MAKMPARTLEALKGSIAKWEAIVAGTGKDEGCDNCPLCKMFLGDDTDDECAGCPVSERTSLRGCSGSPYSDWGKSFDFDWPRNADTPERVAIAQAELDFLRSLLPEGE